MSQILNDNLHINNQEISREELIKAFEILFENKLINKSELQRAIALTNEKYRSIKTIDESNIQNNN